MDGIPPFIVLLLGLFLLLPPMVVAGFYLCRRFITQFLPLTSSKKAGVLSFLMSFVLSSLLFCQLESHIWRESETKHQNQTNVKVEKDKTGDQLAWEKFARIEGRLYNAKDDIDPAVQELRGIWDREVKIGPYHKDGKRELGLPSSDTVNCCPEYLKTRWFVGTCFSPATPVNGAPRLNVDGTVRSAESKEYTVAASRHGDLVDVDFYADYPVSYDEDHYRPEYSVMESIGAEAFDRYVGKISVHPRCEQPKNLPNGQTASVAILSELTSFERNALKTIVKSGPCVVQVVVSPQNTDNIKLENSPYVRLRRSDTALSF